MTSESSIRCKRWREKRKNDEEYWNQERSRKREARRTRSEENRQHDRELSRKRQKKYRDRKKQRKSYLFEIDGVNDDETAAVTEDILSRPFGADKLLTAISDAESVSMLNEYDSRTARNFLETDCMKDRDAPLRLHDLHSNRSAKETAPQTGPMQNMNGEADLMNNNYSRQAYFETIQAALSQIEDFVSIKSRCNSISQYIEQTYPIHDIPSLDVRGYHLDNVASSLYPHDDSPSNLVPIRTVGDGNCLPRVGSVFAFGDEKHHVEMRVRIFMELCQFEDNYLDDSYLNRGAEHPVENLAMTLAQYSFDAVPADKHKCREVFRRHTKTILQMNTFNGMLSIFALASVLGVKIFSIYPSYGGYNVRPHLHRQVMPRILRHQGNRTVHIMWTNTQGKQQNALSWNPNHFVAVLPVQDLTNTGVNEDRIGPTVHNSQVGTYQKREDMSTNLMDIPSPSRQKVDSPSVVTLQSVATDLSTALTMDEGPGGTAIAQQPKQYNPMAQTGMTQTLSSSEASVDGIDTKRRHEDRCPSHSSEELLYLCTTCNALPICYKCHLQGHLGHSFSDLKACLAEAEITYIKKVTQQKEKLKDDIKKRKFDHEQNKQCIEREIDDKYEFYKEQLTTWVSKQRTYVHDRDQNVQRQIQDVEAKLENPESSVENQLLELRKLPVSQRLSVMSTEPRLESISDGYPCTKLAFRERPIQLLPIFGTLVEIPCQSDKSVTGGFAQATFESGQPPLPNEHIDETQTKREGFRRSSKLDADIEIYSRTPNNGLSKKINLDARVNILETNTMASSISAKNDQTWIPGPTETLAINQQQSTYGASQDVQSSAHCRSVVSSPNGQMEMINRLSPIQNSTGKQISEGKTMQNQGYVTFSHNAINEHESTSLNMFPLVRGAIDVNSSSRTNYHHHIPSSSTNKAQEPPVMTPLKRRHCDPSVTGLLRMETENNRYNEDRPIISNDLLFDRNGQSVNLRLGDSLTSTPTCTSNDYGNVVMDFTLPFTIEGTCYFQTVGSMLYIYDDDDEDSMLLFKVSKAGVIQEQIVLKPYVYNSCMCVSPVDHTVWFVSDDLVVRRRISSREIEKRFKVTGNPRGILVRRSGDVLVYARIEFNTHRLTLYTDTGQVRRSIVVNGLCLPCYPCIKECPQTYDIATAIIGHNPLRKKLIIYDSSLTSSHEIELNEEMKRFMRDFCFDGRGHVVVCSEDRVDMFEQNTGVYIRTVLLLTSDVYCQFCDVDEDNILWDLIISDDENRITGYRLPNNYNY